jgi:cytochrome c-type biogenesis protein CcmE
MSARKNRRFMVGLVGVSAVVTYLIWTGARDAMVYFITPSDLVARIAQDQTFREVGVKVGGQVVPGSYSRTPNRTHRFTVVDIEDPTVTFPVEFGGTLPDTFRPEDPEMQVVVEGRMREDGVFMATSVLAKCGSRYEASEERLAG